MKRPAPQGSSTNKSISDASDESRGPKHRTPEEQLAVAIRELRQSLSLTQVQLATALGITPTSIYRYEAGSSFPDVNTLASFWQFAINKGSPAAIAFTAILASAIPALQPVLENAFQIDAERLASASETRLTPDEGLLVMAFMKLLHSPPTDPLARMARKVCETLLEPWYEQSKKELSQHIQEHFRQAFRSSKQPTETSPKPARTK
ncbi:MAG: helix-turn-helix transcriptional regulator [Acidobacteriaceae bacterium]|nr:helix-turn-helix transcriptional regulator [Acidobacteriaceae bacterium]